MMKCKEFHSLSIMILCVHANLHWDPSAMCAVTTGGQCDAKMHVITQRRIPQQSCSHVRCF